MHKNVITGVFIFLLTAISLLAQNGNDLQWGRNLEKAFESAQKDNKIILLYFSGSDWCRPCIQLKEEVFNSEPFKKFSLQNFSLVQIDFPAKSKNKFSDETIKYNERVAEKYNSSGAFPFVLLIDKKKNIVAELSGYKREGVESYINKLKESIKQAELK